MASPFELREWLTGCLLVFIVFCFLGHGFCLTTWLWSVRIQRGRCSRCSGRLWPPGVVGRGGDREEPPGCGSHLGSCHVRSALVPLRGVFVSGGIAEVLKYF